MKKEGLKKLFTPDLLIVIGFFLGLGYAMLMGWRWKETLLNFGIHYKLCVFKPVCPQYTYVVEAISADTLVLDNGAWLKLDDIQIASDGAQKYLNEHYFNAPVVVKYNQEQDFNNDFLLGRIWKEHDNLSASDYLVNYGFAKRLANVN